MYSPSLPQLAQWGAYSTRKVYTPQDITDIVQYAKVRGVRVLPEFDAPAHVGNGWQFGEKEGKWFHIVIGIIIWYLFQKLKKIRLL